MINHYERADYPKLHMAGISDIFRDTDDYSYIKGQGNIVRKSKANCKQSLAARIFHSMMSKMLDDIIEHNAFIMLPAWEGAFLAEQVPQEVFERLRQDDKLKFVDVVGSQGKYYQIIYRYKKNKRCQKFRMITGRHRFKRMTDLINKGKSYFGFAAQW